MNIFYLHNDPKVCAEMHADKHVVKMILEYCQLLSTAHRVIDGTESTGKSASGRMMRRWVLPDGRENKLYKATHINHPSALWVRKSYANYVWLWKLLDALCTEYTYRYGKEHKCYGEISYMLSSPPKNLQKYDWTPMPSCMADEYIISENPIDNYRNYYKIGKAALHNWKKREAPNWIKDN